MEEEVTVQNNAEPRSQNMAQRARREKGRPHRTRQGTAAILATLELEDYEVYAIVGVS